MTLFGIENTTELVVSGILHAIGAWFLYRNRKDLLYDNEDNNASTPPSLSSSRCWSWLLFYIAFSYWLRYSLSLIPPTTPFPPALQEMLYACLMYEFAKKGIDVSRVLLRGKFGGGWGSNYGYSSNEPMHQEPVQYEPAPYEPSEPITNEPRTRPAYMTDYDEKK